MRSAPLAAESRRGRSGGGPDGWGAVAGAFLVTLVGFGAIYSYAAFADAIAAEFRAPRGSVAFVYTLSAGGAFFVSALSGRLADRVGARPLAAAGMVLVATGFLVAAAAGSMTEVLLGYGLLVGIGAGAAYVPAVALVQQRFVAERGVASGLAVSGVGVGTALVPALGGALLEAAGWRGGFVVLAAASLVAGLAGAALLRPVAADVPAAMAPEALPQRPGLARLWAGVFLMSLAPALPFAFLAATAQEAGLPRAAALALLGTLGIGTIAGRFLLAALGDLAGRRRVFLGCCAAMALSMLGWAGASGEAELHGFALAFGLLHGGMVALLPAFIADRFGPVRIGGVIGLVYTARGAALVAAPAGFAAGLGLAGGAAPPLLLAGALGLWGAWLLAREQEAEPRRTG